MTYFRNRTCDSPAFYSCNFETAFFYRILKWHRYEISYYDWNLDKGLCLFHRNSVNSLPSFQSFYWAVCYCSSATRTIPLPYRVCVWGIPRIFHSNTVVDGVSEQISKYLTWEICYEI